MPVWHSSITVKQSNQIERVQKEAFRIILGQDYIDYEVACTLLAMEPLNIRRAQLCLTFAKRDLKRNQSLFSRVTKTIHTRRSPQLVKEFKCRTKRYQLSSMPYLSKLLNSQCQWRASVIIFPKLSNAVTCWIMGTQSSLWFWSLAGVISLLYYVFYHLWN